LKRKKYQADVLEVFWSFSLAGFEIYKKKSLDDEIVIKKTSLILRFAEYTLEMEEIQGVVQEVRSRLAYCVDGWKPKHPFDFFDLRRFEFMKNSYKGFDHFWWFEDHRYAMMSSLVYLCKSSTF
jgi:hypothetical protein